MLSSKSSNVEEVICCDLDLSILFVFYEKKLVYLFTCVHLDSSEQVHSDASQQEEVKSAEEII